MSFFGKLKDANKGKKEDPDAIAEKNNSLLNSDPFGIPITMDEFIRAIKDHKISNQENRIRLLAETIRDNGQGESNSRQKGEILNLGIIEDYALGFRQHNTKVFMFGQAHKALGCFESKIQEK